MPGDNWQLEDVPAPEEIAAYQAAVKKRIQELEDRYNELVEKADE